MANYRLLPKLGCKVIPVIKVEAYGHGLVYMTRVLAEIFAVGTVKEGVKLRLLGGTSRIVSLLGLLDNEKYDALFDQNTLPYVADFGTGMARLGFVEADLEALLPRLKAFSGVKPVLVHSHLFSADDQACSEKTTEQDTSFARILKASAKAGYSEEGS